jgi:beta-lactamase regulating signal transducer with metallopeptidase domain
MLAMPLLTQRVTGGAPSVPPPIPAASNLSMAITASTPATPTSSRIEIAPPPADPTPSPAPAPSSPITSKQPASWLPARELKLGPVATHWLVGLYLAITAFMANRLLCSWRLALRIVARATPARLNDATSALLNQCCECLGVKRPRILVSSRTSSPLLVGVIQPSLLLPEDFAARLDASAGRSDRELEAIWLHELAHLRRRDFLANLVCRVAALPIAYHPATFVGQQRIRQTREMVCDAIAAAEMQSPLSYARCLVSLARDMQDGHGIAIQSAAVGMFDSTVLEERIMQLIQVKPATSVWTRTIRLAGALAMMLSIVAAPAIFHVTPMMAQTADPTSSGTAIDSAVSAAAAATTPSPDQAQPAPSATPAVPGTPAGQKAEVRKKAAKAKAANVQSKAASVEFRKQMEDARKRLDDDAKAWSNLAAKSAKPGAEADSPAFKQRMDTARKQLDDATEAWNDIVAHTAIAERAARNDYILPNGPPRFFDSTIREKEARINSDQLQKQLAEAAARVNSPEFKKHIAEAQDKFNNPEFKAQLSKQMADAQAKFNSPEFKEKIADAQAKFNSPEFKENMEKLNRLEFNEPFQSQFLGSQMQEIRQEIDDALKTWSAIENAPAK